MALDTHSRVRTRGLALTVLLAMQLMIILDGTVVTVALPTIQRDLAFSQVGLAWVVNAYLVAFAGLLLLSGRLGDLLGSRRVFMAGLSVFTVASLVCGLAESRALLVGGRFVQGVGAALASAVILGMITGLYPDRGGQARALGAYSFVSAGGASVGLVVGGLVTEAVDWHWAFLVNVPLGAIALSCAPRVLAASRGTGLAQGADALGAVLVTTGLGVGVLTVIGSTGPDSRPERTAVYGALAALLIVAFVARQAVAARPLLPLRLFRDSPTTWAANLVVVLMFAAGFGFQFLTALYLQRVLGYDALQTGLAFLPGPVMIGGVSLFLSARLTARVGARGVLLTGLALFAGALALMSRAPVGADYLTDVMPVLVLMGTGMGLAIPTVIMVAMSGVEPHDAGLASGLNNTAQQVGAALGTAALAGVATSRATSAQAHSAEVVAALRDGYGLGFLVAAGLVSLAAALALTVLQVSPVRRRGVRVRGARLRT